jgi:hypothetical protein
MIVAFVVTISSGPGRVQLRFGRREGAAGASAPIRPQARGRDPSNDGSRVRPPVHAKTGRPSVPPEQLLRAVLLQIFYSVCSERMLMEQLKYNLLFRWFVRLDMDEPLWTTRCSAQPGTSAEPGGRARILPTGSSARQGAHIRRALHGGWDADRGQGRPEEP